tara:strand:- start:99 stop:371 length:273 start_codon:yes stop_codon:yes gene_type:complete
MKKVRAIYAKQNNEGKKTDLNVHHCTSCGRCWEKTNAWKWKGRVRVPIKGYYFYDDFPTYGKKKKNCVTCNGAKLKLSLFKEMKLWEVVE